jgi:orotate phosphoribosyltransferase
LPSASTPGTTTGNSVVEQLAGLDDHGIAVADVAVTARPTDKITLRQGARVVRKNWDG